MSLVLRKAWSALGLFLRGFTGVSRGASPCTHDSHSAREAFADQASRRGRCC